jgi:hypothetical protein
MPWYRPGSEWVKGIPCRFGTKIEWLETRYRRYRRHSQSCVQRFERRGYALDPLCNPHLSQRHRLKSVSAPKAAAYQLSAKILLVRPF